MARTALTQEVPMKAIQAADRGGYDALRLGSTFPGRSLGLARPWSVSPQRE